MNALRNTIATSVIAASIAFAQEPTPKNLVPSEAVQAAADAAIAQNGFVMANGRVYQIRNGQATPVERELVLKVTPTSITGFDGRPIVIPPGQMFTTDGRLIPLPFNINGLPNTSGLQPVAPVQGIVSPGSSPGTGTRPGTSPGTGVLTGSSPGTGSVPGAIPGAR